MFTIGAGVIPEFAGGFSPVVGSAGFEDEELEEVGLEEGASLEDSSEEGASLDDSSEEDSSLDDSSEEGALEDSSLDVGMSTGISSGSFPQAESEPIIKTKDKLKAKILVNFKNSFILTSVFLVTIQSIV